MKSLRNATDLRGGPVSRDLWRARLLAARRKPVGSINRRAILGGYWDGGNVVGAFLDGRGSFKQEGAK